MPVDVIVHWKGSEEKLMEDILINLFIKKIKAGMPLFISIVGKSSSGKSAFSILIQDIMYRANNLDYIDYVEQTILIKPDQYSKKVKEMLDKKNKHMKKAFTLQTDEAKFLINSESWGSFRNKAIRTITATSRAIKPIIFIIIAQLMRDIDKATRLSLDYYFEISRSPGVSPRVIPYVLYEDTTDIEKVKIKKRRLQAVIVYPNGTRKKVLPVFRPKMPRKELYGKYNSFEVTSKQEEIFKLLDELDRDIEKLSGDYSAKVKEFAAHLIANPVELEKLGQFKRGKWKVSKETMKKYNYTSNQIKLVEELIQKKFNEKNKESMEVFNIG